MMFSEGKKSASTNKPVVAEVGKPLWEGHRGRLRRRMEREGWNALKPHEMVELVLYHAVPRQDLSDISRMLVNCFGSVGGVFRASRESLLEVEGMTPRLAEWILITGRLMRAYYGLHTQKGICLSRYSELFDFLSPRIGEAGDARLWAVYAGFDFKLITYTELCTSEIWWDPQNVRKMVVEAVNIGARYVFLVRFLPEEAQDMDKSEKAYLESIAITLRGVDVDLVDCVLVGGGKMHSMNAEDRMQEIRAGSSRLELHENYVKRG